MKNLEGRVPSEGGAGAAVNLQSRPLAASQRLQPVLTHDHNMHTNCRYKLGICHKQVDCLARELLNIHT